jgi:hypothetical protein
MKIEVSKNTKTPSATVWIDQSEERTSFEAFLEANRDDSEVWEAVRRIMMGEHRVNLSRGAPFVLYLGKS